MAETIVFSAPSRNYRLNANFRERQIMVSKKLLFAAFAAVICFSYADSVMAQGRRGFGGGGKMEYLANEEVQKELDLLDEQVEDLKAIRDESRDIFRNAFSGMREKFSNTSPEEREEMMKEIRAKIDEEMKTVTKKMEDVLVPHQLERLEQIVLQQTMRRGGTSAMVDNESFREKVGLTDDEAEKLKEKEAEVQKELEEEIKKLREEARDKILSVLPAAKQTKIKEILGDAFEMSQRRGRDRGGRGGADRGGRGGDRGGRGRGGRSGGF
jgi:Spy/CpxP family protein refolding chaperone